ncbi:hypothetical protein, partial [Pseudomonas avellanae]|uniref:hypothetical protein n=2 Tax=Pseudomonas avellanae TaxID=46257 RepID=UPI001ED9A4F3
NLGCGTRVNYFANSTLVKLSVVVRNPFEELLSRTPIQSSTTSTIESFLTATDWDLIVYAAGRLAIKNPRVHERTLFAVAAISQLNITHSEFFHSAGEVITLDCFIGVEGNWILRLDSGDVAVPNTFIEKDLKRFCDFRGLSLADGNSPLIQRVRGVGQTTRRSIIKLITSAFQEASRYAADPESFLAAGKAWIYAEASLPKVHQRKPSAASSNVHPATPPGPQPLFSDFKNVRGKGEDVADHADTLLFLASCPGEASPSQSYTLGKRFLYTLKSKHTYEAYRKFVERLLLWSMLVKLKPIQFLTQIDLHEFSEFSKAPPGSWVRTTLEHRFIKICAGSRARTAAVTTANPAWRPYRLPIHADARPGPVSYHASNETVSGQFAVIRSFYNFLLYEGAVDSNPLLNRAAFLSYGLQKKASPRKRQGITEEVFRHVIEGCMENLDGFHLIRMIFIIYTINELQLSWAEVRDHGRSFTLDMFKADGEDSWCASINTKGAQTKVVPVNRNYIETVLNPYAEFVSSRGLSGVSEQWLFSSLTGNESISVYRITRVLNEVCRAAALKIQQEGHSNAVVERLRHVTINDLANAPKPAAYMNQWL